MQRTALFLVLFTGILLSLAQDRSLTDRAAERKAYLAAEDLFRKAENLFDQAGENEKLQEKADAAYRDAAKAFDELSEKTLASGYDSLSVLSFLRAGLTHYYLGEMPASRTAYLQAFRIKPRVTNLPDSLFFLPFIYAGGLYHTDNRYDSALYYYELAEKVQEQYEKPLPGSERLYNRLGVMLYENGNYAQARNYFEKAIELTDNSDPNLVANYRINIASILIKLEDYQEAKKMFEAVLPTGLYSSEVHHNLAIIYLHLNEPTQALSHLKLVAYENNKKSLDLFYNYAMAYSKLGERDSTEFYYQRALAENAKWNSDRRNVPYGLLLKFKGDLVAREGHYSEALKLYQKVIIQFHAGFSDDDPEVNPSEFGETFSYINLFNALTAKGDAYDRLPGGEDNTTNAVNALNAYESAFRLAHFIERTYDSDESRLFLNRIKHSAHSRPIDICIRLYRLTEEKRYLENAYLFDQRNKASVLSLNMRENELRSRSNDPLLRKETQLRTLVTRLSLKAPGVSDSAALQALLSEIRNAEIELGKIQEDISGDLTNRGRFFSEEIPPVKELQKKLDSKTAVVSWHLSEKDLLALIIRGDKFTYKLIEVDSNFIPLLDSFRSQLQLTDLSRRYDGTDVAVKLYELMMLPLQADLNRMERLIIIPDDELSYIPFEALQDVKKNYLIDKFSIQYQFSTPFITRPKLNRELKGTLAFAPFALRGFTDSSGERFEALPASLEEVDKLKGTILIDSTGSKTNFLISANKYATLHLATHATVNNENPGLSYIAFYPAGDDYKLYAREIYDLRLDSTELVILSACETGMGRLIKGEGLMSLSRAFAFAGCPNIIMSLWKAEDKTTAYITQRLHHYLADDHTRDDALRLAKKDLLADKSIDPRFKTPNYWAHLLFIGEYEKVRGRKKWLWMVGVFIVIATGYVIFKRFRKEPLA